MGPCSIWAPHTVREIVAMMRAFSCCNLHEAEAMPQHDVHVGEAIVPMLDDQRQVQAIGRVEYRELVIAILDRIARDVRVKLPGSAIRPAPTPPFFVRRTNLAKCCVASTSPCSRHCLAAGVAAGWNATILATSSSSLRDRRGQARNRPTMVAAGITRQTDTKRRRGHLRRCRRPDRVRCTCRPHDSASGLSAAGSRRHRYAGTSICQPFLIVACAVTSGVSGDCLCAPCRRAMHIAHAVLPRNGATVA